MSIPDTVSRVPGVHHDRDFYLCQQYHLDGVFHDSFDWVWNHSLHPGEYMIFAWEYNQTLLGLCSRCDSYWHMLPGLLTFYFLPLPSSFAAVWLVAVSFPSASIGSKLPHTDVPNVERQSNLSKSSERKAAGENLTHRLKEHQAPAEWWIGISATWLPCRVYLLAFTISLMTLHCAVCTEYQCSWGIIFVNSNIQMLFRCQRGHVASTNIVCLYGNVLYIILHF